MFFVRTDGSIGFYEHQYLPGSGPCDLFWPGAEIGVVSRSAERAADFESWAAGARVRVRSAEPGEREAADLIVNATPVGLRPGDPPPLDAAALRRLAPPERLDNCPVS